MPDPFKNVKIIELMELFDDDEVTTADQIDRPQKALDREMFQNAFREEKAGGGMLVEPGFGGTRQGYRSAKAQKSKEKSAVKFDKFRVKIPTGEFVGEGRDKSEIFKIKNTKSGSVRYTVTGAGGGKRKLYTSIEEVKKAKLKSLPDELVKVDSKIIKEGIKEVTYKNKKTGKIVKYYKPRVGEAKETIPGKGTTSLKEAEKFIKDYYVRNPKPVRDPTKDYTSKDVRKKSLQETDPTKAKGTKKFQYHHIRQIAGGVPLTTDDVMIINQRINSKIGGKFNEPLNRISAAIQKNNRLALEAMNNKQEGLALDYMKRVDDLNAQAEKIVNSAIDELPKKYKGYVGFNQFTLPRDEYGLPISNEPMIIRKVGGMPVSKDAIDLTTLNLKQQQEFRKLVKQQADRGKVGKIDQKILQNIAKLGGGKCATQKFASGGRINLADSITCIKQGLENIKNKNLSGGPQQERIMKNLTDLTKTTQGAKALSGAARIVAGLGVGSELALGGFFAITDYATGANKQELLSNLTYGLAGKDVEEQLTEKDPMYGKAQKLEDVYTAYLQGLDKTGKPKTINPRGMAQRTRAEDVEKAMEPFQRISPQTDTGQFFDLDMFETQKAKDIKALEDFEKEKKERALERGFYDPDFDVFSPDRPAAAGGGLLKQAGDRSGAMLESMNPDSQGLSGLLKRGNKI